MSDLTSDGAVLVDFQRMRCGFNAARSEWQRARCGAEGHGRGARGACWYAQLRALRCGTAAVMAMVQASSTRHSSEALTEARVSRECSVLLLACEPLQRSRPHQLGHDALDTAAVPTGDGPLSENVECFRRAGYEART